MSEQRSNKQLATKLAGGALLMFGFGFALVPLYDVFCEITGLNGKTDQEAAVVSTSVDQTRTVKVEFITHTQGQLPWQFKPEVKTMMAHPGQTYQVNFVVKNLSDNDMVVQAIPSVSPGLAATHFNKIECFCFNHQPLKQGEEAKLGLLFYLDQELPSQFSTVTLAYTLFDITDKVTAEVSMLSELAVIPKEEI